jgi:hypothetical protein
MAGGKEEGCAEEKKGSKGMSCFIGWERGRRKHRLSMCHS